MARVRDDDEAAPQIPRPVGSLAELEALGVPTRNICSCSAPKGGENGGCKVWHLCDRDYRGTRPQMEVVRKVNRAGKVRVYQAPCFDTILKESSAAENKELYEVIGHEGDEYTYRGSTKKHPTRNPDCNACVQGKCEAYEDRNDLKAVCAAFPPAAEHPELVQFAELVRAKQETGVRSREAIKQSLLGDTGKVEDAPKVVGSGRRQG